MDKFKEDHEVTADSEEEVCYGCSFPIEVEENQLRIIWGWKSLRGNIKWKDLRADITWESLRENDYTIYVYIFLSICLGGALYCLYAFFRTIFQGEILDGLSMLIPIFLIAGALFYIVYSVSATITLDRLRGIISVRTLCGLRSVTADFFDDDEFRFDLVGSIRHGNHFTWGIRFVKANYIFDTGISMDQCDEFKVFLQDYMDCNSALPRGTAFDPYRQKDYERRKAQGFPPSLHILKSKDPVHQEYLKLMQELKQKHKKSEL